MILKDIGLIAADTSRTRAYIDRMARQDLLPAAAVLLAVASGPAWAEVPEFDNVTPCGERLRQFGVPVTVVAADSINAPSVAEALKAAQPSVFIFSGPPGAIVGPALFATGKRFLHVHPGRLPDFRGSTTIYYSLLKEEGISSTALFLDQGIDSGRIVGRAEHPVPADRSRIDGALDAHYRADLLVRVLRRYAETGCFDEAEQGPGTTYYVIHPVLKHIAILASGPDRGGKQDGLYAVELKR